MRVQGQIISFKSEFYLSSIQNFSLNFNLDNNDMKGQISDCQRQDGSGYNKGCDLDHQAAGEGNCGACENLTLE